MNRRVYVMDCDRFVKIGVSNQPDRRKSQIPYAVYQYYCTAPTANAFEIERKMHRIFREYRNKRAIGREYFDIPFHKAVRALMHIIDEKPAEENEGYLQYGAKTLLVGICDQEEMDNAIEEKLREVIEFLPDFDKGYFLGKYC